MMKTVASQIMILASLIALGGASDAFAEDPAEIGKEWSKSSFGRNTTYKCTQPACGGKKSLMMVQIVGPVGDTPELEEPSAYSLEAEFRRSPEMRSIYAGIFKQLTREGPNEGSSITSSYFANGDYVGLDYTLSNAKRNIFVVAQLRISNNKALMIGCTAETPALARRNFNLVLSTVKAN